MRKKNPCRGRALRHPHNCVVPRPPAGHLQTGKARAAYGRGIGQSSAVSCVDRPKDPLGGKARRARPPASRQGPASGCTGAHMSAVVAAMGTRQPAVAKLGSPTRSTVGQNWGLPASPPTPLRRSPRLRPEDTACVPAARRKPPDDVCWCATRPPLLRDTGPLQRSGRTKDGRYVRDARRRSRRRPTTPLTTGGWRPSRACVRQGTGETRRHEPATRVADPGARAGTAPLSEGYASRPYFGAFPTHPRRDMNAPLQEYDARTPSRPIGWGGPGGERRR